MAHGKVWQIVRRLGAVSLIVVGAVHLREYTDGYAEIETIGGLFLLNFMAATIMAVGLLLPVERFLPRRWGTALVVLLALGGVGLSASSLIIDDRGAPAAVRILEPGFHPEMIQLSRISEVTTVVLLGAFLIAHLSRAALAGRPRGAYSQHQAKGV